MRCSKDLLLSTFVIFKYKLLSAALSGKIQDMNREHWLNGWGRMGDYDVLIGTGVHCVGCGKDEGTVTVVFPADYQPPEKYPDWPFDEETCPVHKAVDRFMEAEGSQHPLYKVQIGGNGMPIRSLAGKLPK